MNAEMDIILRIKESTIKQLEKAMCKIKHYETAHAVSGFLIPERRTMEYPLLDKKKYRDSLLELLLILDELADTPSSSTTRDTVINALRLSFEIKKELYRIDSDK